MIFIFILQSYSVLTLKVPKIDRRDDDMSLLQNDLLRMIVLGYMDEGRVNYICKLCCTINCPKDGDIIVLSRYLNGYERGKS